jgi:peptidylprolyl isomerase
MIMLKKSRLLAFAVLATVSACNSAPKEDRKSEEQQKQEQSKTQVGDYDIHQVSEALGHFIGRNMKAPGIQFDIEAIIQGMREGAAGKPPPMSDEEYEKAMAQLQQKAYANLSETNLTAAEQFMQQNANTKGLVEIVPGKLQYIILEPGNGPVVPEHGTPLINYTGKYIDGTVFGSSENAGGPITVPIDQTIPGFSKGIAGMKEGEKRRLFVHPDMGYGKTGQLPPNSLLIFDIEVVKSVSPDKDTASQDEDNADDGKDLDDDLNNEQPEGKAAPNSKTPQKPAPTKNK